MTGQKKLSDKLLSYLYGHGLSKSELSQLKSVAPSWIPEQYFQFWKHYTAFSPPSLVFFTPAPYGVYENAFEGFLEDFRSVDLVDSKRFFPVAYDDGFVWGVFEQKPNGSVICGMYDFQEKDYVEGPFKTFEQWVYSYG